MVSGVENFIDKCPTFLVVGAMITIVVFIIAMIIQYLWPNFSLFR